MRLLPLASLLLLLLVGWRASAADADAAGGAGGGDRAAADALAAQGTVAMHDADADPHRGVDAAILFSQARTIYLGLGDSDAIAQMQANIFWCKKRMNLDDLQSYLAHKGGAATTAFTAAKAVMDISVPSSESGEYLARAKRFQADHPDEHFAVAIRFSEIIERFPDTDAARSSEPIFVKEQSAYLAQVSTERQAEKQQLQDEINKLRETRFMTPLPVTNGATPVPSQDAQDKALVAIKASYKADYQRRRDAGRRALARKLYAECDNNRDDAGYYYAMLEESARIAMEVSDWEQMLLDVEKEGATFANFDIKAHEAALLKTVRLQPVAEAILTLLSNPRDRKANGLAGRDFCFLVGRWDLGLPMLADGVDAQMSKTAEMELGNPSTSGQMRVVGDAWYELGKHGSQTERFAMWGHADDWYEKALPGLTGINHEQAQKADEEIQDALPLRPDVDWSSLTVRQWEKIKAWREFEFPAKVDRSGTGIELTERLRVRVVPYPDDRSKMVFQVGPLGQRQEAGVLSGDGVVWVIPTTARRGGLDTSSIRLKVIRLDDE